MTFSDGVLLLHLKICQARCHNAGTLFRLDSAVQHPGPYCTMPTFIIDKKLRLETTPFVKSTIFTLRCWPTSHCRQKTNLTFGYQDTHIFLCDSMTLNLSAGELDALARMTSKMRTAYLQAVRSRPSQETTPSTTSSLSTSGTASGKPLLEGNVPTQ